MRKRPGEVQRQENPLIALFPEMHTWFRERGQIPTLWIYVALALLTLLLYLPSAWHDFIALADYEYVRDNPHVANGLTWENFLWAFRTGDTGVWQPLVWLSHMRDCQFFGVSPAAQHANNVLLHICNVLLLYFALVWFTGDRWCSAFVATLFAVHPLNVESVSWIAERKDLLGTFFFLLALLAYGQYLERRGVGPYLLLLLIFALGLMASPMILTLPFVLLLVDYWPLRYFEVGLGLRRILYEKIPLFALSAVSCVATFLVHKNTGALSIFDSVSISRRLVNALLSYARYLGKIFWPANLAIPYRYDQTVGTVALVAVGVFLAGITVCVIYFRRRKQYLVTSWFWFLGMLVPAIGFVQVGAQSMADRYAYISSIGILIGISWGCADLFSLRRIPPRAIAALTAGVILVCVIYFRRRKQYLVTGWFWFLGMLVPAIGFVQVGAQSMADRYAYISSIGILIGISWGCADLFSLGRIPPRIIAALTAGVILVCVIKTSFQLSYWQDTETLLQHSVEVDPKNYLAFEALGDEFQRQKRTNEKMDSFERALQVAPERAFTRTNVAITLGLSGHPQEAVAQYEIALRSILPSVQLMGTTDRLKASDVANNLAWIRATALDPKLRDSSEALQLAQRSIEWSGGRGDAVQLDTLAAAQAQAGQFDAALTRARQALGLAQAKQELQLVSQIERHISLYEMGQPFIEFPE